MGSASRLDDVELARLFGLVHRGTPGDVEFYVRSTTGARHVLELGSGAGRVLAPIAKAGTPITGLERSAAMIEAGRQTWLMGLPPHAHVLLGDMRSFSLRERFDRIIIPYNSLFAMDTDSDIERALRGAFMHLEPDGLLLLDCYSLDEAGPESGPPAGFRKLPSVIDGGQKIEVFEQEGPELPGRRFEIRYRYRISRTGKPALEVLDSVRHHFAPPGLLLEFIRGAGFVIDSIHGDFDGRAWDEESSILVIQARKPAGTRRVSVLAAAGAV